MTHTELLALLIVIVCVFTFIYPRKLHTPASRKAVHVPILVPILYLLYEVTMPARYNIRADLFLLWPIMAIALGVYLRRINRMKQSQNSGNPQR